MPGASERSFLLNLQDFSLSHGRVSEMVMQHTVFIVVLAILMQMFMFGHESFYIQCNEYYKYCKYCICTISLCKNPRAHTLYKLF